MKKVQFRQIVATLLLMVMLVTSIFSVFATQVRAEGFSTAENAKKTVRVGYVGYEGFIYINEEGELGGYGVEYLSAIEQYADVEFVYVYCNWSDSLEMLRNREIDLVCTAFYSEERAKQFEFSSQNFGRVRGVLYTSPDNDELHYEDFEYLDGKKIAFLEGSMNNEIFREYADKHDFGYEEVLFATEKEMEQALAKGEVVAMATEQMSIHDDLKLVGVYGSTLYYLMSYKDNGFMSDINEAMMDLFVADYDYEAYLYNKYYGEANRVHALCFTREEIEYIKENPTITVGMLPGLFPLSYCDEETGEAAGIYASILKEISEISGLNLVPVVMGENENPVDTVGKYGMYDMAMSAVDNKVIEEDNKIIYTDSFMDSSIGMVGRPDLNYDLSENLKIAINDRFVSLMNYLRENSPNCKIVTYETDEECLEAVLKGEADIMMQSVYVINYLLQKPSFESLQMIPTTSVLSSNAFIVGENADPRLISIINKSIHYFSSGDLDRIVIEHTTALPYDYTVEDVWVKYQTQIIMIAILLAACMVLLGVLWGTKQKNYKTMQAKNLQLREAVHQAIEANKSKSDFFARISHEIRTPINAIVGMTEIAKKTPNNLEKTRESLDKIEASSKVLLSIVNDILDISAIENAKMKIANEPFEFNALPEGIKAIYESQCKNKGIQLVIDSEVKATHFRGDSLRVNQILLNLVSNAFKFTPEGGTITLKAYELGTYQGITNVRFMVEDTGEGMSEEMLERLFAPFEQASSTTAQKHGGSGLGLAITKSLVDMMGGQIAVESHVGKGTRFIVDLPFGYVGPEMNEDDKATVDEIALEDIDFTGYKILLAEDNELNQEIAVDLLAMVNAEVEVACNGREAVEMFVASPEEYYSAILMDIQMPELNGYEATKEIRKSEHPRAKRIGIIAMTANSSREDITAAMSAGMSGHIAKPIDTENLYRTLWDCVND